MGPVGLVEGMHDGFLVGVADVGCMVEGAADGIIVGPVGCMEGVIVGVPEGILVGA